MSNRIENINKSILIFGGGLNQLELIKAAKSLGVISVVVDPLATPACSNQADFFYQVEGNDYEATKEIAIKHNIDGIVTGQMEKPLRIMSRLADEMGYIFHSPLVIEKCLDKSLMKQAFLENEVPCAKGKLFFSDELITLDLLDDFQFPLIIKPVDAFSSRGVYRVNNLDELNYYLKKTRSYTSLGRILVEEFLEGSEYSIETITFEGKTIIIQFTEKFITPFPNTVEMGHLQPANLSIDQKKIISDIVVKGINALGINNSAGHTEVKLTSKGPKIIEIGARLGGDFISSYLTKASTGINMDKAAVQIALGFNPEIEPLKQNYAFIKYIEFPVGKQVKEIKQLKEILKIPEVVFIEIFVKPGEIIQKIEHSAQRPACFIVKASSYDEVKIIAEKVEKLIKEKFIRLS